MNDRERFLGVFRFGEVDRVPDFEFGYWLETIDRWHSEGLPSDRRNHRDVGLYLGFDTVGSEFTPMETLPVRSCFWPTPPGRVLEETEGKRIMEDGMGGIYEEIPGRSAIPHYIRHPIEAREDWERLKAFFDAGTPGRFPVNWDEVVEDFRGRDYPLGVNVGSLYGWLRNWMGVKNISIAFYRDPDWIAEMMDALVDLWIKTLRKALRSVRVDFASWWEDMCYNRGPLVSVRHFEEFMVPRYRKVTNVLEEHGVEVNILDCDGDITHLVPGWLEGGINCMFPLEARCNDVYDLRERFGERLLLMGGVDKFALMQGKTAIDEELKRLTPLLRQGGYIPTVDHRVPPEVSLADYRYYLERKREWIGKVT